MTTSRCPACGGDLEVFHEVLGVPVNSCLLADDGTQARAIPRGDLRLALCRCCGFITNTAFDPAMTTYDQTYEETQEFSGRFLEFAEALARRWIETYSIRGQDVLEIGCGKGSFLATLCDLGENRGIGVDPSAVPSRLSGPGADRIRFVCDTYDERYADLPADVVVCRPTLEHIGPVRQFLDVVRRAIGDRADTILLFELPDTLRVLREGAFWDVYYEHCSYFTASSLAGLFRRTGFEVLDTWLGFDGQYLLLEARPGCTEDRAAAAEADAEALQATSDAVEAFRVAVAAAQREWSERLCRARAAGSTTVLWGGGSKAVAFLTTLGVGEAVDAVVDINPHKQGTWLPATAHPVVAPAALLDLRPDLVVVMNPAYESEVGAELAALGLQPQVRAL